MTLKTLAAFPSAESAWRASLRFLLDDAEEVSSTLDPLSVGSLFGKGRRPTREALAIGFSITNPRARLCGSVLRRFRPGAAIAYTLWTLAGSDDLASIAFYNPLAVAFSDDSQRLRAAPGGRIFAGPGNQFAAAINLIKADSGTRRALIQIYWPTDLLTPSRDNSCTGSVHFLVRGGALHCVVTMRSQSAAMVMPYDVFLLTMLHEMAAVELGLPLGEYKHFCHSLHFYLDEERLVRGIVEEDTKEPPPMPAMLASALAARDVLVGAERNIRERLTLDPNATISFQRYGMDAYWARLFEIMVSEWRAGLTGRESVGSRRR